MISGAVESFSNKPELGHRANRYGNFSKRALDLLLVCLVLPFTLPVLFGLALAVKLDGGPAFYSQIRVGMGGRRYRMWKLRSMVVDADRKLAELLTQDPEAQAEWEETQKLKRDPRVTRIGAVIRKTSLDELPQIWNVVIGDMSLVGPRPFLPEQEAFYPGHDYYKLRPGLTGLWQVHDRNGTSFGARAVFDSRYYRELSLKGDIRIIMATVRVVLRGTGY